MARHASGHRVDRVADLDPVGLQGVGHFTQGVLRLGHRHAISRHDDHRRGFLHEIGGVFRGAGFDRAVVDHAATAAATLLGAKTAQDDVEERTVHALTHDVGQDRAGRANQGAGDDQGGIGQGEANAASRPSGVRVKHRHDHRHIGAANRNDQ